MQDENFFKILDLPVSFSIDESRLNLNYVEKQQRIHPDVSGDSRDSSLLNSAYAALKDPVTRAEHFLVVKGYSIDPTNSKTLAKEMFNIRSEYGSLKSEKEKFRQRLCERMDGLVKQLAELERNLDQFYEVFCLLKFINSFLEKEDTDVYCWN